MIHAIGVIGVMASGATIGALVERWRWLRSPAARDWMEKTGERGRLF